MLTFSAKARFWIYQIYAGVGLVLGAYGAALGALKADFPDWYVGTVAALAFLGTGLGFTAAANVRPDNVVQLRPGQDPVDPAAAASEENAGAGEQAAA